MPSNDAAQSAGKIPSFATLTGSAPVNVPKINGEGALTGETEDLGVLHAPDPVGHFMLVALPKVEMSKTIIIDEAISDRERAASVIGTVLAMGPDCYKDEPIDLPVELVQLIAQGKTVNITVILPRKRFPSGPWCKLGDTVLVSRYAGKRFKIEGIEFRMLNDDEITATIPVGAKVGGL